MRFTKMHGTGNDYVYVNCMEEKIDDRPAMSVRVSDRHFGVGSDGLVCIEHSDTADYRMEMYNADGSRALMCGNGIRCVAKYVYDKRLTDKTTLEIETDSGIKTLKLNVKDGRVQSVRVDMGKPDFRPAAIPALTDGDEFIRRPMRVLGVDYEVTALSVGNPHAVIFVPDADAVEIERIGPGFDLNPIFPERVNTEFVQVLDRSRLKMRVWERGSGETLACGTGATASLAAAAACGLCGDSAAVQVRGGELFIEWDRQSNQLYMTGPAEFVFDGELYE